MNILIACEESQEVCKAFREKGHNAFSCDLQTCSGGHPEWHINGDVLALLDGHCIFETEDGHTHLLNARWDMIIAHPPCTYLTYAGNRNFSLDNAPADVVVKRWQDRAESAVFFMRFVAADCDKVVIENPVGFMNTAYRRPDMIIHPYYFAESVDDVENYQMKRTCLWLKGVEPLIRKVILPKPEPAYTWVNSKGVKKNVYFTENHGVISGEKHRGKDSTARSKTFSAVARAMADQWG